MLIKEELKHKIKEAMRNKDKVALNTFRLVVDRIQKKEKDLLRDLTEDEVVSIIQTFKKQLNEEIEAFDKAGKAEKVKGLEISVSIVDKLLPQQMTEDEIILTIHLTIASMQRSNGKINKGSVMKEIMPYVKGKADNKKVSELVSEILNN